MSQIVSTLKVLSGTISAKGALTGTISTKGSLQGEMSAVAALTGTIYFCPYDTYSGPYEAIPKAFKDQHLQTSDKVLKSDVTVKEVPYFEVTNVELGKTVYIAKET